MYNMYEFIREYMLEHECSYQEAYAVWEDAKADLRLQEMKEDDQ